GSVRNTKSVGPSCKSNGTALLPIGFAGFSGWFAFSSMPVPSSYNVIENVFVTPACAPAHASFPNSGTLIQRILNAFTFAKPTAITGNVPGNPAREPGFRSVHAGAIFGAPLRNAGTVGILLVSPTPNVMFPFEFQKNPFHTHPAVATGPPNTNSNPPDNGPGTGGVPAPLSSSPRNGLF